MPTSPLRRGTSWICVRFPSVTILDDQSVATDLLSRWSALFGFLLLGALGGAGAESAESRCSTRCSTATMQRKTQKSKKLYDV
jgi:hypothetical protein